MPVWIGLAKSVGEHPGSASNVYSACIQFFVYASHCVIGPVTENDISTSMVKHCGIALSLIENMSIESRKSRLSLHLTPPQRGLDIRVSAECSIYDFSDI